MLLFLLITLFSCQVLFIQQRYLHMASHDAKSLNPRKWMSDEQLFSLPLGFILYERFLSKLQVSSLIAITSQDKSRFRLSLCMTVEIPTSKSRFKMTTTRLKRGRVQRNNSPSKSQEVVGFV